MKRYYKWLKRRLFGSSAPAVSAPTAPCVSRPAAEVPSFGFNIALLRERFAAISIDGSAPGELAGYARQDLERFLRTVELVPAGMATALEIGANPYFTTILLSWLRPELEVTLTNYFGNESGSFHQQEVQVEGEEGSVLKVFKYVEIDAEHDRLPFDSGYFQVVLFCEVLEHLTVDPVATLFEIRRILSADGYLVLTTPNVARVENRARLMAGLNIYDPYSGHGVYGRHNREYTLEEVRALLIHCGFEEEVLFTADVHPSHAALHVGDQTQLDDIVRRAADCGGQYIFSRWRVSRGTVSGGRPSWLYRSLPLEQLSTVVPLAEPAGT